jgi:hypothetical protein
MAQPTSSVKFNNPEPIDDKSRPTRSDQHKQDGPENAVQNGAGEKTDRRSHPGFPRALDPLWVNTKDALSVSKKSVGFSVSSAEETPQSTKKPSGRRSKKSFKFKSPFTLEFHWASRKVMLGCLAVGVATMLGHHFYYYSLVGHVVGDIFEQQRTRMYDCLERSPRCFSNALWKLSYQPTVWGTSSL